MAQIEKQAEMILDSDLIIKAAIIEQAIAAKEGKE